MTMNIPSRLYRKSMNFIARFQLRRLWARIAAPKGIFRERYALPVNPDVFVYTWSANLFPTYPLCRPIEGQVFQNLPITLIATLKNEEGNVQRWIESIYHQSRLPQEIILVDAGSTDHTVERLHSLLAQSPVPAQLLIEPGANIARGRNLAIAKARHALIAVSDFGCTPRPDWLENLILPFEIDPEVEVVAGWYQPVGRNRKPIDRRSWPRLEQVKPAEFLPSSRSLAFRKKAWELTGGYPEWLTLTGEDTYFALELKSHTTRWAFAPKAVVAWEAPEGLLDYWSKQYAWSIGDGESGVNTRQYWLAVRKLGLFSMGILVLAASLVYTILSDSWVLFLAAFVFLGTGYFLMNRALPLYKPADYIRETGTAAAQLLGYSTGYSNIPEVESRRLGSQKGVFFILSGVPIDDTGGGARATQLALALLKQHFLVIFINHFPKYEGVDLNLKIRHPNLLLYNSQEFAAASFWDRYGPSLEGKPLSVLVEFPLQEYLDLANDLKQYGGLVIYDLIDDWESSLGGAWYAKSIEESLIQVADHLVATAPILAERLEQRAGREVVLLPNAVNTDLFNPHRTYLRPPDLPTGEKTILYIGALWGSWFDWDLVSGLASHYPQANVVLVGDYHGQAHNPPSNLYFLGLKQQGELPAYLAYADVAIIPFKVNEITLATSPLKVYEYIAMHRPVVATDLPLLREIPLVLCSKSTQAFFDNIGLAFQIDVDNQRVEDFLCLNSWQSRVDQLIQLEASQPIRLDISS
jgi:glycosyltransferase involved in cell wall biosynthesis